MPHAFFDTSIHRNQIHTPLKAPSRIHFHSAYVSLTETFGVESLRDYFSQFGEVQECTVMRDGATGRSRGFGFLTFRDARTVNIVMVKEHYLDGKIVRPNLKPHETSLLQCPSLF